MTVTSSPISAVTFSLKFTLAMEADTPTRPTAAPITVEFTALTFTLLPPGRLILTSLPLFSVASTVKAEALSITVLSPISAPTDPP